MAKALELTWVAKLRQWRKRRNVGGKRTDFYLGTGDGPDDRESYRRALGKWKVIEAELDALKAAETLQQKYEKWGAMLAARQRYLATLSANLLGEKKLLRDVCREFNYAAKVWATLLVGQVTRFDPNEVPLFGKKAQTP